MDNSGQPKLPSATSSWHRAIVRSQSIFFLTLIALALPCHAAAPNDAYISDAWWTYQQDCNGDTCKAGTLPGDKARLNWAPDVVNCSGTLTVYEKVYTRISGTGPWTPIHTNAPHVITGCQSLDLRSLDVPMTAGCVSNDYRIEIFRNGQATADYNRSSTNDTDLAQHKEQLLADDFCLSDFFASCVALSGRSGSQSDYNATATKEVDEPDHAGTTGGHSLWYCWTAPTNQPVTFDTLGSSFDTVLAVYTGSAIESLTVVTNNDDIAGATNRLSRVTFTPVQGTTYRIAVDGYSDAAGIVMLNWNQTGAALGDLIVWGPAASPFITTTTFSSGNCEVTEGCVPSGARKLLRFGMETRNIGSGDLILGNPTTNSLFIWASCHGHYHFEQFAQYNLLDTNGAPVVSGHKVGFCVMDVVKWSPTANPSAKYTCINNGIQAGWADIYDSSLPCQYIDITGVPSGNYLLQLIVNPDGLLPESNMDNNVALVPVTIPPTNCLTAPINNHFTNAIAITNTPACFSEFNNCATKEPGEPNHAGNPGGHSIWYSWTADTNQTITITTRRSDFDTTLAIYTGSAVGSLSMVATNDDIATNNTASRVTFAATAGTTYSIAVDGFSNAVGTVVLNIAPCPHDDFATSCLISGSSGTTNSYNIGASKELNEPAHAYDVGGHSIWFSWTAPKTGPVDFNTLGSGFDTTLAVYTNNSLSSLVLVAANDEDVEAPGFGTSRIWFHAIAGRTYRIAVDGFGGDTGDLFLNWNMDSILQITTLPDGNVEVTLTGVDWHRYTLLGSTDFETWFTNNQTITMSGGAHQYINSVTNQPQMFYRAVRVP